MSQPEKDSREENNRKGYRILKWSERKAQMSVVTSAVM